jgi:hypothetical protein
MIPVQTLLDIRQEYAEKAAEIQSGDQYPFYAWCCKNVKGYKTLRGNLEFRKKILELAANDIDFKNDIFAMCKRDMLFAINTFYFTYNPEIVDGDFVVPFITYSFQDVVLDDIKYSIERPTDQISEKSRKMGASWMNLTVFTWKWNYEPHSTFRLLSRNEDLVDRSEDPDCIFWKIDFLLENLPVWMQPNYKRVHLLFKNEDNQATLTGLSTTSDAATGGRCTAMLLDEFAKVPDGRGMLSSTRDVTRCRVFNSTHKGSASAFYSLTKGKTRKVIIHWSAHPERNKGLYYSVKGKLIRMDDWKGVVQMGDDDFNFPEDYNFRKDGKLRSPYYDNECDRAEHPREIAQELDMDPFSSDSQYFDPEIIEKIEKENVCNPYDEGEVEFDADSLDPLGFVHGVNGPLKLWVYPDYLNQIDRNLEIGVGVDIAAGTGASNSTATFVNLRTGEKLAEYANPWVRPEYFAHIVIALCRYFNDSFMVFDASGPTGRVFSDELIRVGYRNIYYRRDEVGLSKKVSDKPGIFLNTKEKAAVLGAQRRSLKDGTFIQRSHDANQEYLEYIQKSGEEITHSSAANSVDPSGAGQSHGDRVISDALANKCIQFMGKMPKSSRKGEKPRGDPPKRSFAGRKLAQLLKSRKSERW